MIREHPRQDRYPYQKPDEQDRVICPESQSKKTWPPTGVYEGRNKDGKPERRGILGPHSHRKDRQKPCPWEGLPVPVTREDKKE